MVINISGRNIKIDPEIRSFINSKIQKILSDLKKPIDCNVIVTKEKSRIATEIIIHGDHGRFYFKKEANDIYASIEQVVHTADLALKKFKSKKIDKRFSSNLKNFSSKSRFKDKFQIINYEIDDLKPLSYDEAILQIKQLKHKFILFIESRTEKPNLIYKEDDKIFIIRRKPKLVKIITQKDIFTKFLIEEENNKYKFKVVEKFEPEVMNSGEALSKLKQGERFIIFKEPEGNEVFVFFWLAPDKIGSYKL